MSGENPDFNSILVKCGFHFGNTHQQQLSLYAAMREAYNAGLDAAAEECQSGKRRHLECGLATVLCHDEDVRRILALKGKP